MSAGPRVESRGIRCLDCPGLCLQKFPDAAKTGMGWCTLAALPHYVALQMARNCVDFVPAVPEVVAVRDAWAEKTLTPFWRVARFDKS